MNQWRTTFVALSVLVAVAGMILRGQRLTEMAEEVGPKNLVVVMACTTRKDQVTPYGAPPGVTPHLDQLARNGALFEDVIASSSWTKESAVALFTGHQAIDVGMVEPGPKHSARRLSPLVPTLASRLASHGWHTIGVTANPHLNKAFGLAQGFAAYEDTSSRGFSKAHRVHGAQAVERALDLVDERPGRKPVYLRVVLIDPHAPLDLDPDEVAAFSDEQTPPRIARYRAGLNRTDQAIAALDAGLQERGLTPKNTVFVVVTDHGEGLNHPPHHRGQHGRVLYRTLTEVPWILRGPRIAPDRRVGGLASHLDVLPTLLGLLELPGDPSLEGQDWSALLEESTAETTRTEAFTETWYFAANRAARITRDTACQSDFGSTVDNDSFEPGCFSRADDPDWTTVRPDPVAEQEIRAWRDQHQDRYEAWPDTADADHQVGVGTRAQLKALGYVE